MMLFSIANKALAKILLWEEVFKQRKQLSEMDDDLLKDIGISRVDAEREAHRKFWDCSQMVDESLQKRTASSSKRPSKMASTGLKLGLH